MTDLWTGRRTTVIVTVAVLIVGAATAIFWISRRDSAAPKQNRPLDYAYTNATELVIQTDRPDPIRVPGTHNGGLFWTHNGTYVVANSGSTTKKRFLTVVNVKTGAINRVECGCWSAVPVGGDRVAYVDDATQRPVVHDLATGAEPQTIQVTLPQYWRVTQVMASGGDTVLVRAQFIPPGTDEPEYSSPDVLYAVRIGDPTATKVAQHHFIVGSSAVGGTGPDGKPRFGVTVPNDDGRCNSATYWLYDGTTGQVTHPPDMVQSAPNEAAWMIITDWWWDANGTLHANLATYRCTDAFDEEMTAPPSLWRLDGPKWTKVDVEPAYAVRRLDADTILSLREEGDIGGFTLYRVNRNGSIKVATQVYEMAVAPTK